MNEWPLSRWKDRVANGEDWGAKLPLVDGAADLLKRDIPLDFPVTASIAVVSESRS